MSIKDKIPGYNNLVLPYHYLQSLVARKSAGSPDKKLHIIGITGTNGKTTTSFMIWKMLNEAGFQTGLMTTVAWGAPDLKKVIKDSSVKIDSDGLVKQIEHMTTVKPSTLNYRIKAIANSGAEYLVLEVTSHALAQFRTLGLHFDIAIMTNVTHEHLDYHKTFENYLAAKCKLFKQADYGIINADDKNAKKFINTINNNLKALGTTNHENCNQCRFVTYGINNGIVKAKNIKLRASGVEYECPDLNNPEKSFVVKTNIPGEFNVYNSLAAVCAGQKLGLSVKQIQRGLLALENVEGRMNRLNLGQSFEVLVDFAHTPDAFEKVFTSVAPPSKNGRVISLFGGAGRRDETTRKDRGMIAGKYSDICILTEDDSRDEDTEQIISMFEEGCLSAGLKSDQIIKITDRGSAIKKAISIAKPGDLVLILGKGHEKTILRADGPHPFEDLKVTAEAIKSILK